jgi:hypothetical protein
MAQETFPITGQPMSNAQWAELAGQFTAPGVAAEFGAATSLLPFRTAAGLFLPAGEAVTTQGAYYRNTDTVTVVVPQNATGTVRNDLLVLRHDFAVAPEARLTYLVGGAVGPSSTVATDVPLGRCLVPSGSNVPLTVADARTYTSLGVIPCRTVADIHTRQLVPGRIAFEFLTGLLRLWNGNLWVNVVLSAPAGAYNAQWVSSTGSTSVGAGGEIGGDYTRLGNVIHWTFNLLLGGQGMTGGPPTPFWRFTLPVPARLPNARQNIVGTGQIRKNGVWRACAAHRHGGIADSFIVVLDNATEEITGAYPGPWVQGDEIRLNGTYVAA